MELCIKKILHCLASLTHNYKCHVAIGLRMSWFTAENKNKRLLCVLAIEKLSNEWDSNPKPLNHKGSFLPLCYINCSRARGIEFLKFQWSFWLVVKLWWFCARASDFSAKSATRCLSFCNNGCKKDNLLSSFEAKNPICLMARKMKNLVPLL